MSLIRSAGDSRLKRVHLAIDVIKNQDELVDGIKGNLFALEDEEAFLMLKENVEEPKSIRELRREGKIMIIENGNGLGRIQKEAENEQ